MDDIIKLLDQNLTYVHHRIEGDVMYIYVESSRDSLECPYCSQPSTKVHSRYERSFQDLPIQGYKVMIDIDSHKIIDMIESRELDDVKKWLATYPNLSVVSRDGSVTYKNAITQSHPNAIQVSDRFHIIKNLTNYCKECIYQWYIT